MEQINAFLVFPMTAFHLVIMFGCVRTNLFMLDIQLSCGFLKWYSFSFQELQNLTPILIPISQRYLVSDHLRPVRRILDKDSNFCLYLSYTLEDRMRVRISNVMGLPRKEVILISL